MVTNSFKIVVFLFLSVLSYGQTPDLDGYTKLLHFEFDKISNSSQNVENGKYYAVEHHNDGEIKRIKTITYINGYKEGESLTFRNRLGIVFLSEIVNYKKGVKNGYYFNSDNHTFIEEGYYTKDLKEGLWTYSSQETKKEVTYKNGVMHGSYTETNNGDNGYVLKGDYKNNQKDGIWLLENTSISIIDKNGKRYIPITKETYKKGVLLKTEELQSQK